MNINKSILTLAIISSLTLSACGSSDSDSAPKEEVNTAPTNITLSNTSVEENSIAATLGNLSAVDANSGDTFTYSVSDARFSVSGNKLSLAAGVMFDFETETTVDIDVTVTDSASAAFTKTITIEVTDILDTYSFMSKVENGVSSVSYGGQIARHVLIAELNHYIGNQLDDDLKPQNAVLTTRQQVLDKLNTFYKPTTEQYPDLAISFLDNAKQGLIAQISNSSKDLNGKIAGKDGADSDQHKDWSTEFVGWGAKGSTNPDALITNLFNQLADNAEIVLGGASRISATDDTITKVYLNTDGTDLKQLIQKFLLMAVTYSQGTDDYLDNTRDDGGLNVDNIGGAKEGTKAYTALEHHFDEGFGYFGASREYLAYNDNELSGKVSSDEDGRSDWNKNHDTDGDTTLDLTSEFNFGNSVNAAKRDRGTAGNTAPTDYTKVVMEAFITGRKIINDNVGSALTADQSTALLAQRDIIVSGWEKAIAATVVHYINDVHADLAKLDTDDFSYQDAAKHFSELKGFALGLQFNPHSPITDEQFAEIHTLIGDKPVLDSVNVAAYQVDLMAAREILATALSFNAENVTGW